MICPETVKEVERMLIEGQLSHRQIAAATGVGRTTVGAIAAGKRIVHEREELPPEPEGPPRRCPGCGGLVYLPCQACHVRSVQAQRHRGAGDRWPSERRESADGPRPLGQVLRT